MRTRSFYIPAGGARRHLYVNAAIPRGKTLRVGVINAKTGKQFRRWQGKYSTVVRGDRLQTRVTWAGKKLGRLRSKPIKLLFIYTGSLYSFQVRE